MEARLVRERVVVEGDRGLGLGREPGARRAVIILPAVDLDLVRRPGRTGASAADNATLSVGGTKSSTRNSMVPIGGAFGSSFSSARQVPMRASRASAKVSSWPPSLSPVSCRFSTSTRPAATAAGSAAGSPSRRPCRRAPAPSGARFRPGDRCRARYRDRHRPARAARRPLTPRSDRSNAARPTSRKLKSPFGP